jgi:hypothetical protein
MGLIEEMTRGDEQLLQKLLVNIPLQLKAVNMPVGVPFLRARIKATPIGKVSSEVLGDALCRLVRTGEIDFLLVGDDAYFSA